MKDSCSDFLRDLFGLFAVLAQMAVVFVLPPEASRGTSAAFVDVVLDEWVLRSIAVDDLLREIDRHTNNYTGGVD